ncbi:putative phospholipase A2 [Paramyrothecium foliicola]|nr:putative phospholipase A2 [Paramyrothecium foliicola]
MCLGILSFEVVELMPTRNCSTRLQGAKDDRFIVYTQNYLTMSTKEPTASAKLAAYLARMSPIPAFPEYTGPYKVGTMDVEIPVTDFSSPTPAPDNAADIPTIQYRVFYPAVSESNQKRISWLPNPQRQHVSAYTQFVGVGSTMADVLSFIPRHLHYTTIPVHKNATLREPETESKRWPTMIFSHGLGGSRNSYSYIAGSLASHGVVVFCPEHRDGSAVATFVRLPDQNRRFFTPASSTRRAVPYRRIPHDATPEVQQTREDQLRIRCWELGLLHQAILAMDAGRNFTNMNVSTPSLDQFIGQLDVNEPGKIIFAGHSFGAATVYQLLKSVYYAEVPEVAAMKKPLFRPAQDADIKKQITEKTVTMLLDMWSMPLLSPGTSPLFNLPLPVYADVPSAPGGNALMAVESEAFFKWKEHLHLKARLLSPDPSAKVVTPQLFERPSGMKLNEPSFYYVINSAHLNQSDFGILFPWLTKKIFDAQQPERALRLNLRSQLQFLRMNGFTVARTYAGDLVDGAHVDKLDAAKKDNTDVSTVDGLDDDKAIFDRSGNDVVDHWKWIDIMGMGDAGEAETGKSVPQQVEDTEPNMADELEPGEQLPQAAQISAAAA